ncbi:hypothetical protein [Mesorhizobium sp. LCM 4577]
MSSIQMHQQYLGHRVAAGRLSQRDFLPLVGAKSNYRNKDRPNVA